MEENMQIGTFADDNSAALSDKAGEAANADWDGFTDQDNTADPGENADRQDAAEEVREGAETDLFTLKHLDERRTVNREEVIALAQKGLDYDRIRAKYDALRAKQPEQDSGPSDQEPAGRTPAEGEEQPPDPSPAEGVDQPPYRPGDAAGEALRRQSYMRFSQEFPGIKPEEIPAEIWRDFAAGRGDLADLFARHENRQLKAQLAVARQNEENRRRSTGSRATAGSTVQSRLDADWYDGT